MSLFFFLNVCLPHSTVSSKRAGTMPILFTARGQDLAQS